MKSKLFSKRMTRGIVCGLVGVLVLSVSAFAAYGSTSGYGKYKDALTKLVLDTDNVTMKLSAGVSYDGDTPFKTAMVYKYDGKNFSRYEKTVSSIDDNSDEWYYSVIDGTATQFWSDGDTYDEYPYEGETSFFDMGEYSDKMVKFLSVFADTVVGDLKNNVVLVNDEDGIRSYSLDVTADQVPALISAGLDLVLAQENTTNYVSYEDYDAGYAAYYEKTKGEALPEGYFDTLYDENNTEMWDEYDELTIAMDQEYNSVLQDQYNGEGILYVKADGTYQHYATYSEYAVDAEYGTKDFAAYLGKNAVLSNVKFNFSLDEKDRLVSNDAVVTFSSTDPKGTEHEVKCSLSLKFSDYGTTVVTPFDTGDRTKLTNED